MNSKEQAAEIAKYTACYKDPNYRMGPRRKDQAKLQLGALAQATGALGSYLDVGCGRGEMLDYAREIGFARVEGTEVVPELIKRQGVSYAEGWALPFPDRSFEVVSLFDVIEHVLPGDDERICRELARVASRAILITASNRPSVHEGVELHINRRPYDQWDRLFRAWFGGTSGGEVDWLDNAATPLCEMWRVLL